MAVAPETLPVGAQTADGSSACPAPRSRRRGAVLERAILDAAWEEVVEVGYGQVTMAGVAARAGTNKATLYRRWPNRTELLATAIGQRVVPLGAAPIDTGILREDVIAVLQAMGQCCRAIGIITDPDGQLAAFVRRRAAEEGFENVNLALLRASERGEIDIGAVTERIARLPVGLLYSELCLAGTPVSDSLSAEIVDDVFLPLVR